MFIIGLTGPSGGGKGALARAFDILGTPSLDTDVVYHALVAAPSPCVEELRRAFGDFVVAENGGLSRSALAKHVFCGTNEQSARLALLNGITHKFVLEECRAWLKKQEKTGHRAAVIDAPLLFESGFDRECDYTVAVLAPLELRTARIMIRDGIEHSAAASRIAAQPNDDFYRSRADFTIINDGSEEALMDQAKMLLSSLLG